MISYKKVREIALKIFREQVMKDDFQLMNAQLDKNDEKIEKAKKHLNMLLRQMVQVADALSSKYFKKFVKTEEKRIKKEKEELEKAKKKLKKKDKGYKKEQKKISKQKFKKNISITNEIIRLGLKADEEIFKLIEELEEPFNSTKNILKLKPLLKLFSNQVKKMDEKENIEKATKEELEKLHKEAEDAAAARVADEIAMFLYRKVNNI